MADEIVNVAEDSARGSFFLISGTALATVVMSIATILIARLLGDRLYGQYTLALVIPQLLFLFTDLGISIGITKFVATFKAKNETSRLTAIVKNAFMLRSIAGITLFITNYAFAETFASFLQRPELAFYIRIVSFSILFQVIFATAASAFVGLDRTEYSALTTNIQALTKTVVSVTLVLLGLSITGAVVGHTASYAVASVAGVAALYLILREKPKTSNNFNVKSDLKNLMLYGAPLYTSILLTGLIPLYKNFILALFTSDVEVGNYKAATNFVTLMSVLSIPITTVLLPAFTKLESSTTQRIKMFFKIANKYTAMLVIPAAILLIVYSSEAIQIIYGHEFETAAPFLATYCLLYLLVGLGYLTLTSFYNGLGETLTTLKISLITFTTLAILSPILAQTYRVQGVIIAFLIASLTGTTYGSYKARKRHHIEFDTINIVKIYLSSAFSSFPAFLLLYFTTLPNLIKLIAGGLIYLLIYITLIPLTEIIIPSEHQTLTQITKKIKPLSVIANPILKYQQRLYKHNRKSAES